MECSISTTIQFGHLNHKCPINTTKMVHSYNCCLFTSLYLKFMLKVFQGFEGSQSQIQGFQGKINLELKMIEVVCGSKMVVAYSIQWPLKASWKIFVHFMETTNDMRETTNDMRETTNGFIVNLEDVENSQVKPKGTRGKKMVRKCLQKCCCTNQFPIALEATK